MHYVLAVKEGSLIAPIAQAPVFAHTVRMLGSDVFNVMSLFRNNILTNEYTMNPPCVVCSL